MRLHEFTDPSEYLLPETDRAKSPNRPERKPPPDVSDEPVVHSRPETKKIKLSDTLRGQVRFCRS